MARLSKHAGIIAVHKLERDGVTILYAICNDGNILRKIVGNGPWKIVTLRLTRARVEAMPLDTSAAAKAMTTRANRDAAISNWRKTGGRGIA